MKNTELSEQALDALLRSPLEVPDGEFSAGVLRQIAQRSPSPASIAAEALWPAWLVAVAAAVTVLPWENTLAWLRILSEQGKRLLAAAEGLSATALAEQSFPSPEPALLLPVALALGLLLMLIPLTAD